VDTICGGAGDDAGHVHYVADDLAVFLRGIV